MLSYFNLSYEILLIVFTLMAWLFKTKQNLETLENIMKDSDWDEFVKFLFDDEVNNLSNKKALEENCPFDKLYMEIFQLNDASDCYLLPK